MSDRATANCQIRKYKRYSVKQTNTVIVPQNMTPSKTWCWKWSWEPVSIATSLVGLVCTVLLLLLVVVVVVVVVLKRGKVIPLRASVAQRVGEIELYSSMTAALEGGEWTATRPSWTLPPGKTQYPLYRRLGGPQGRSGQVRKISPSLVSISGPSSPWPVAIPTELPGPMRRDYCTLIYTLLITLLVSAWAADSYDDFCGTVSNH